MMLNLNLMKNALRAIAKEAIKRSTGARGLKSNNRRYNAGNNV